MAIGDASPAYRQGLALALSESGFAVEEPPDVVSWLRRRGTRIGVLAVAGGTELVALARVPRRDDARVVALLADPAPRLFAAALGVANCFPVAHDAPLDEIVSVVVAAVAGRVVLPLATARELIAPLEPDRQMPSLDSYELAWLDALASGATVSQVARAAGYSEREMYRRLNSLYRKMGTTTRTQAVVRAAHWGLIRGKDGS